MWKKFKNPKLFSDIACDFFDNVRGERRMENWGNIWNVQKKKNTYEPLLKTLNKFFRNCFQNIEK